MKAKTHLWSSLAVGAALGFATRSPAAIGGALIGGFAIDADHLIDQLWSIAVAAQVKARSVNASDAEKTGPGNSSRVTTWLRQLFRRRPLLRLPLIFHSYELLLIAGGLLAFDRTPFIAGLVIGYALHLSLDLTRHHHEFRSPLFYLLSYRMARGFRRELLIKPEYL
jgi:hypothetical protein